MRTSRAVDLLRPWRPRPGEWDAAAAQHLHRRAGFGATPAELERALAAGPEASLARLFEDHGTPELRAAIDPLLAAGDLELLAAWWMGLILEGGAGLRERMTLLWHAHFATSNEKVDEARLMHAQNELFRMHGLGDFRALLHAVARDPAMLVWLDGDSNRRGHPNENFARELFELFALGIGNYGEDDVRAGARAFSGWGTAGRAFAARPEHHDDGEKTLFGQRGCFDGDQALELVLAQPACARHVARLLLTHFVAPASAEDWFEESVEALAEVLRAEEWNLAATLRRLLSSELFYSSLARRARIAGPVELLAVAARALGARVPPLWAARRAAAAGQALFRPPSVKGWDGGRAWIHSGAWIARHNALVELLGNSGERGAPRLELETLFPAGAPLGPRVLGHLLPEGDAALATALERAERDAAAGPTLVALVLTSPEFQLF